MGSHSTDWSMRMSTRRSPGAGDGSKQHMALPNAVHTIVRLTMRAREVLT